MLRRDLEQVLGDVDRHCDGDIDRLLNDEHERIALYVSALATVTAERERELVALVLRDPDHPAARSAVCYHIDTRAPQLRTTSAITAWAATLADLVAHDSFLCRRIEDWRLFADVVKGRPVALHALSAATPWMQRKLAEEASSLSVLAVLAETGLTKKIRNIAGHRANRVRRTAGRPATHEVQ